MTTICWTISELLERFQRWFISPRIRPRINSKRPQRRPWRASAMLLVPCPMMSALIRRGRIYSFNGIFWFDLLLTLFQSPMQSIGGVAASAAVQHLFEAQATAIQIVWAVVKYGRSVEQPGHLTVTSSSLVLLSCLCVWSTSFRLLRNDALSTPIKWHFDDDVLQSRSSCSSSNLNNQKLIINYYYSLCVTTEPFRT